MSVFLVEKESELGGWVGTFGEMYPHGRNGRELIAGLAAEGHRASRHHRLQERRGRQQERDVRQLSGGHSSSGHCRGRKRRAARRDYRGQRGLHRRGHRLPELHPRRRRVRLRPGGRPHAARVQSPARGIRRSTSSTTASRSSSIAYIYCVGSRQPEGNEYCSRYCCTAAIHASLQVAAHADGDSVAPADTRRRLRSTTSTATSARTASTRRSTTSRAKRARLPALPRRRTARW